VPPGAGVVLPPLPPLPRHPLRERPSLLQPGWPAAADTDDGTWMTTDNDDVGDIVYHPAQVCNHRQRTRNTPVKLELNNY